MFDRPKKFGEYFYTTVHRFFDEEAPRIHEDVELKPGEKVGLVIGNQRYVFSLDEDGKLAVKTQKRVMRWEDVGEVSE